MLLFGCALKREPASLKYFVTRVDYLIYACILAVCKLWKVYRRIAVRIALLFGFRGPVLGFPHEGIEFLLRDGVKGV